MKLVQTKMNKRLLQYERLNKALELDPTLRIAFYPFPRPLACPFPLVRFAMYRWMADQAVKQFNEQPNYSIADLKCIKLC